jgi:hypothetical protein
MAQFRAGVDLCCTHIPIFPPLRQVGVVYPAITADMLSGSHQHVLGGSNVYNGRLSGVCVRYPYCDGEAICCAAKGDWKRA